MLSIKEKKNSFMESKINIHNLFLLLGFIKKLVIAFLPAPLLRKQKEE